MKFGLTKDMRKKIWLHVIVIAAGVSMYFAFDKIGFIIRSLGCVCSLTTPFILGSVIAFLLNKPMELIEVKLLGRLRMKPRYKRNIVTVLVALLGIIIICAFLVPLLPQLLNNISSLMKTFPSYVEDLQKFALDSVEKYAIDTQQVTNYITGTDLFEKLTGFVTDALPQMAKTTYAFGGILLNTLLSTMADLYTLIDKERLSGYAKKINYALLPKEVSKYLHHMVLASGDILNNFVMGKVIDSLITGIPCYIESLIFQFPYALLLSVVVGVTNMTPVFGPFIGTVPGIVILFAIHPTTVLYFALFVFVPQQFDGSILRPLIPGDKLGLPGIGTPFSACVGGGLFDIISMFIGVPCFAIIYMAVEESVNYRLKKKEVNLESISREMKRETLEIEERMEQLEE